MEKFESARSQIFEERRRIQKKVDLDRRMEKQAESTCEVVVQNKRIYLYGQMKANRDEELIRKQLLGL